MTSFNEALRDVSSPGTSFTEQVLNISLHQCFASLKEGKDGLERKLEKEEREYMEAAQAEHNENNTVQELKATVQASREKVGLSLLETFRQMLIAMG